MLKRTDADAPTCPVVIVPAGRRAAFAARTGWCTSVARWPRWQWTAIRCGWKNNLLRFEHEERYTQQQRDPQLKISFHPTHAGDRRLHSAPPRLCLD